MGGCYHNWNLELSLHRYIAVDLLLHSASFSEALLYIFAIFFRVLIHSLLFPSFQATLWFAHASRTCKKSGWGNIENGWRRTNVVPKWVLSVQSLCLCSIAIFWPSKTRSCAHYLLSTVFSWVLSDPTHFSWLGIVRIPTWLASKASSWLTIDLIPMIK